MSRSKQRATAQLVASGKVITALLDHRCGECFRTIQKGDQCQRQSDDRGVRWTHWPVCPVWTERARPSDPAQDNARLWAAADQAGQQHEPPGRPAEEVEVPHVGMAAPNPATVKGRLFSLMWARANGERETQTGAPPRKKGWVNLTTRELSKALTTQDELVSEHEVVHCLHDMKALGLVDFNLKRTSRNMGAGAYPKPGGAPITGIPVNIRVTKHALSMGLRAAEAAVVKEEPVRDEVSIAQAPLPDHEPTPQVVVGGPERLHGRRVEQPDGWLDNMPLSDWPEAERLLAQEERLRKLAAATALLREAGRDDIADLAGEEEAALTGTEREYARFAKAALDRGLLVR